MDSNDASANMAHGRHPMFDLSDSTTMEQQIEIRNESADGVADLPTSLGSGYRGQYSRSRTLAGASLRQTFTSGRDSFANEKRGALTHVESTTGRNASSIPVSQDQFVSAVLRCTGSTVFAQRLVQETQELDAQGRPHNTLDTVADRMLHLEKISLEDNLRLTFELLDTRRDGTMSVDTLQEVLKVCFRTKKLDVTPRQVLRVAEAIIADIRSSRAAHTLQSPDPAVRLHDANDPRLRGSLKFNGSTEQRDVMLDDLVELVQRHLASMPPHDRSRKRKPNMMFRARLGMGRLLRWRLLPWYTLFWLGMAGAFFAGYYQNYDRPPAKVSGAAYPLAKAFGQVIQPVAFLLMIAVCRWTITALRATFLKWILPLDECINFHRLCGYVIFLAGLGHTVCHIANYTVWTSGSYRAKWVAATGTPQHSKSYWWTTETSITGYIMWGALLLGLPFAAWYPRMSKRLEDTKLAGFLNNFKYFAFTHFTMWFVFYVALILHPLPGKPAQHSHSRSTTWIYVALPLLVYIVEKLYRFIWPFALKTELVDVELAPGDKDVTVLRMRRPKGFQYKPGMYTFVNVPAVSFTEWHPFTISSAPGDPYVSVHIQAVGDWTIRLHEVMSDYCAQFEGHPAKEAPEDADEGGKGRTGLLGGGTLPSPAAAGGRAVSLARTISTTFAASRKFGQGSRSTSKKEGTPRLANSSTFGPGCEGAKETLQRRRTRASLRALDWDPLPRGPPLVLLDGPYAAPAQHWEDYDVLLLVGGSIGVTPFASIMADLVNRLESPFCSKCGTPEPDCPSCGSPGAHLRSDGTGLAVEKVYFHWVVRDGRAPNYLASTLETISRDDSLNLIEPRIHLTSVNQDGDGPDLGYILTKLGQDALHAQSGVDVVTGLQSRVVTEFGRPSWPNILARIADTHPGKTVGIFTCGPTKLCRSVKRSAQDWNARTDQRIKFAEAADDVEAQPLQKTIFHFYEEFF